jgi:hypothetical protein
MKFFIPKKKKIEILSDSLLYQTSLMYLNREAKEIF